MDRFLEIVRDLLPLVGLVACVLIWAVFIAPYTKDEQ